MTRGTDRDGGKIEETKMSDNNVEDEVKKERMNKREEDKEGLRDLSVCVP